MNTKSKHIDAEVVLPQPPFWGSKCLQQIPLSMIVPYINKTALYKVQWGFKSGKMSKQDYQVFVKQQVDPILARLIAEERQQQTIFPQAIYGFYPCYRQGDDLVVLDTPEDQNTLCRFTFPRQQAKRQLCISDFFQDKDEVQLDVVAFQVVTVGQKASDYARSLFQADKYQDYLYRHGLNVESAEALAEYIHKRIRAELGLSAQDSRDIHDLFKQKYCGSRYSFGYPACPKLEDQDKILALLDAQRIGVRLGDEFQLWPEESTSAIVVHHPQAKYFTL